MATDTDTDIQRETLRRIMAHCEADAKELDGKLMTGATTGGEFGKIYAMIEALARILKEHIEN